VEVPDAWLGALGEALGAQLRALSPQDCAYLLWALAQLPEEQQQREQQEALLDALLARSQASLRQYDAWQLAHVAWSLGKMGARLVAACLCARRATSGFGASPVQGAEAVARALRGAACCGGEWVPAVGPGLRVR
jgi:hypothetical protein